MSSADDDLQKLHDVSRGAFECAKSFRLYAFLCELAAAGIALRGVVVNEAVSAWVPLAVCVFLVASVVLRSRSQHYQEIAQRCRRISVRAYALGSAVPIVVSSGLLSDAPSRALKLGKLLPGGSVQDYYGATMPAGDGRLRYLYAYSSFFTWQILRGSAVVFGVGALLTIILSGVVLYALIVGPVDDADRSFILEALFPIVLGVLALRLTEEALSALSSVSTVRAVADRLISSPLPDGADLGALVEEYEFAIVAMPPLPSVVYKVLRSSLEERWAHRRRALAE